MPTNMSISQRGIELLIQKEGFRNKAYQDTKGIWTIGVGHTSMAGPPEVKPGMVLSDKEVREVFARDLQMFERAVNESVHVPILQNEFDAFVSIAFNIGISGFKRSTFLKRFNNGNSKRAVADAILWWNKPPEIRGRRQKEADLFLTPSSNNTYIPASNKPSLWQRFINWLTGKK